MFSVYRWNKDHRGQWLDPASWQSQARAQSADSVLWIDLENPTPEEEHSVYKEFLPVHSLTLEDVTKLRREPAAHPHFPKVEEFADYLFVIVNPLTLDLLKQIREQTAQEKARAQFKAEDHFTTQLSIVLTEKVLVTHHYEALASVRELRDFLSKHEAQAGRGPDYLFHLILDTMVDQYVPVLDHVTELLDRLEEMVVGQPTSAALMTLLHLKRDIVQLRKTLIYEREVLARLSRGEFALIDDRETVYYRNVYDHLVRFTELIESSREMSSDLMQMHLSAMSNKLNEIVKVLTMISTVILPMSLIAGVYGMNFKHMPELDWVLGYPFSLALMLLVAACAFFIFRWKKWL